MRRSSFLILLLLSVPGFASCGNISKTPSSPSSETSGTVASTTKPAADADVSVSDAGTPGTVTNQTATSGAVDASVSTPEADNAGVDDSEEDRESDVDDNGSTSTTTPTAPVTTHGIVTEEPADVFSGGAETWEPDA